MIRSITMATALLCLPFAVGCGGPASTEVLVSGNVSVAGQPVENGSITFIAADGNGRSGGGIIKDGHYTASIEPGEKAVMVLGNKVVGTELILKGVPDSGTRD